MAGMANTEIYQLVVQVLVNTDGEDGVSLVDIFDYVNNRVPNTPLASVLASLNVGLENGLVVRSSFNEDRYCLASRAGIFFDKGLMSQFL